MTMAVKITGPILSALLFEHCNADEDREGLLFGTVTTVVTNKISDSDMSVVETQTVFNIYSFLPFSGVPTWRDNQGAIKEDVLNNLMQGCYDPKEILGWYKLRRNSTLAVSMREHAICRHMYKWLKQVSGIETMIFMLCVSQTSDLYVCDHLFMSFNQQNMLVSLPETVVSLSGAAQPNYKHGALHVSSPTCTYNRVLNKSRSLFLNGQGESSLVAEINKVTGQLHHKLQSLCNAVTDSEMMVAKELAELKMIRKKLAVSHEEKNRSLQYTQTLPANFKLSGRRAKDHPPSAKVDINVDVKIETKSSAPVPPNDDVDLLSSEDDNSSQNTLIDNDGDSAPEVGRQLLNPPTNTSILDIGLDDCDVLAPSLIPLVPTQTSEITSERSSTGARGSSLDRNASHDRAKVVGSARPVTNGEGYNDEHLLLFTDEFAKNVNVESKASTLPRDIGSRKQHTPSHHVTSGHTTRANEHKTEHGEKDQFF